MNGQQILSDFEFMKEICCALDVGLSMEFESIFAYFDGDLARLELAYKSLCDTNDTNIFNGLCQFSEICRIDGISLPTPKRPIHPRRLLPRIVPTISARMALVCKMIYKYHVVFAISSILSFFKGDISRLDKVMTTLCEGTQQPLPKEWFDAFRHWFLDTYTKTMLPTILLELRGGSSLKRIKFISTAEYFTIRIDDERHCSIPLDRRYFDTLLDLANHMRAREQNFNDDDMEKYIVTYGRN